MCLGKKNQELICLTAFENNLINNKHSQLYMSITVICKTIKEKTMIIKSALS